MSYSIDGDGLDDYVFLDADTGAPVVYLNAGADEKDPYGWKWMPLNSGKPIASGAAPASTIMFADIDGDGKADYHVIDATNGTLYTWLNGGEDKESEHGWTWHPLGMIATGLGKGSNVRLVDLDNDQKADYIYLNGTGSVTAYKNRFRAGTGSDHFVPWQYPANPIAVGVGATPRDIHFGDLNGDGKPDYLWTHPIDGSVNAWMSHLDEADTQWTALPHQVASGVAYSGACVRFAKLTDSGRVDYVVVSPDTGAVSAWCVIARLPLGCDNLTSTGSINVLSLRSLRLLSPLVSLWYSEAS